MSSQFIKNLDLFSLPFFFTLENEKKSKKTLFGGLISLSVISLSLAYLIYLCFLYFGNKLQPNISLSNVFFSESYNMDINENVISFKIQLANGQNIMDLQKDGKIYLQSFAQLSLTDENGKISYKYIPQKICEDQDLNGYFCFDFASINEGKNYLNLSYFPDQPEKQKIDFLLLYCSAKLLGEGQYCATPEEVRETVLRISTQIFLKIKTSQYSPSKRAYETKVKQEQYYFSEGLVQFSKIQLQKVRTNISSGFIIQSTTEKDYLSDYIRIDTTNTYQFLKDELKFDMISVCTFFLSDSGKEQSIQFPQFTYVFAQFSCVFNSLLAVGILCKLFAQSELVQDFVQLQLQIYYKKTAQDFISKFEKEKQQKQGYSLPNYNLFNLYKKIQNMHIDKINTQQLNIGIFQRLKLLIFSNDDSKKKDQQEKRDIKIFKSLVNASMKNMNIFEFQKELTKIKLILRMLMSVEQYAAIQLCGLEINVENDQQLIEDLEKSPQLVSDQERNSKGNNFNEQDKILDQELQDEISLKNQKGNLDKNEDYTKQQSENRLVDKQKKLESVLSQPQSHLDKIDLLERDESYFEKCLEKFFENNAFQSELDKRILGSMIGTPEMKLSEIKNRQNNYLIHKNK